MIAYHDFIARKKRVMQPMGFEPSRLPKSLFPWQKQIVEWTVRRGRAAIFAECGLGKTLMQLAWAEQVYKQTKSPVVIHTPVGVRQQTKREAEKFGIKCPVHVVNTQDEVFNGINLVNYEKLHLFDPSTFAGVVLDESSILKSASGATRKQLIEAYRETRYKLACTATPAPNDNAELGSHAEFLGVCDSVDMLNRYFYHDSGDTSKWVLMPHASKDFWEWVASWAVCIGKPSDIGGSDEGCALPPLIVRKHEVEIGDEPIAGMLFRTGGISATTLHDEKRLSCEKRCKMAASIANRGGGAVIVWCDTNYEADMLKQLMPYAIEVRGSDSESAKEEKIRKFSEGEVKQIITKPSITGFGVNWQHCNRNVMAGLSYSFESLYQLVRRTYRFGQRMAVSVDIVVADTESSIESAITRKQAEFDLMRAGMAEAMREATLRQFGLDSGKETYRPTQKVDLPSFLL